MNAGRFVRIDHGSVVVAVCLLAYRFCNLDLVTFINDEPHLLGAAEGEARGEGWVSASPIAGTQGLHYGPVPTWFYGIVHAAFGASPLVSIVAMGLVVTLGQLIFVGMLTRFVRGGPTLFGALTALTASSPFAFAWSRTAWDNTILIGAFACAALLVAEEELSIRAALLVGTLFGISLGTHLMVLPVMMILLALTGWSSRRDVKAGARRLAAIGAPVLVINLPYLVFLLRPHVMAAQTTLAPSAPHIRPPFDLGAALATVVTTMLAPARVFTTAGISYFFDESWADFRASLGMGAVLLEGAWIALFLAAFAIAGLAVTLRKSAAPRSRRLALVALCSWLGYALFLLIDGLDPHPHYQHPVWWTVPVGLALLFVELRRRSQQKANALLAALWILALAQFSFLPMWMHYARSHGGTRGIHFTTPLTEEETWLHDACGSRHDLRIENHTVIFEAALTYLAQVEPACRDRRVTVCGEHCEGGGAPVIELNYAALGGRLAPP